MKSLVLFAGYAYSRLIRLLSRPIFEVLWGIGSGLQSMMLTWRQSYFVDNFATQTWLDFASKKLDQSKGKLQVDSRNVFFSRQGSQEFWRFKTLAIKEPDTIAWLNKMAMEHPRATFIDVGANIGIYSLYWLHKSKGRVICLEPLPSNFLALMSNLRLNHMEDRALLIQGAASNRPALSVMSSPSLVRGEGFGSLQKRKDDKSKHQFSTVALRLDETIPGNGPFLVKIDVEGLELEVIDGMERLFRAKQIVSVLFEKNSRQDEILEYLTKFDFLPTGDHSAHGNIVCSLSPTIQL